MTLFQLPEPTPRASTEAVLLFFARFGRGTDADLRIHFNNEGMPTQRRAELLEAGLVEIVGDSHNADGRRVLIFDLSDEGWLHLERAGLWDR